MKTKCDSLAVLSENDHVDPDITTPLIGTKPPCTICLDKSSGFHYGTHACEGCKGFFRRMVTNSILIQLVLQCTGSSKYKCEINSCTRNNCQRCRLQKCFQMGMTRYKTRLGRRTKAITIKLEKKTQPRVVNSFLNDEEMLKLIKRENKFFNNNEIDDEVPQIEDEIPQAKCIKYKAKLYSEKNSKSYSKYPSNNEIVDTSLYCSVNSVTTTVSIDTPKELPKLNRLEDSPNLIGTNESLESASYSSRDVALGLDSKQRTSFNYENNEYIITGFSNQQTQLHNKIKINSEKFQIQSLCSKIRNFRACSSNTEDYLHFFNCKATINTLTDYFYHPNLEEMEEYYRTRVDLVSYIYNPLLVFNEMIKELTDMVRKIFAFFKRLPDLELFELITFENNNIKKKIIQTLYVWLIRFVNVSENLIYNTNLTMKIPYSVLQQTPLKHFFELLFQFTRICNSVLTMEFDDSEISLLSALIITFPKNEQCNFSKTMLQTDNILKVRFLYCASLYDHIFAERCTQNHDLTENRLQKLCWLISESDLLNENDVNYVFSHFKL